ncbi:site-specific integrase [Ferrimicrobium sp.]|uniref:tyrosine-type recombinase/integrase n=1 Tax=Ferrimicrobium sp. TaxID=2926050 RepID=UPI002608AF49|nr:site-specific integrase [Ferrimicrobium sp.]
MRLEHVRSIESDALPGNILAQYGAVVGSVNDASFEMANARRFLERYESATAFMGLDLAERLTFSPLAGPFMLFLMLFGYLRPGYDYLVERKLVGLWAMIPQSPLATDMERFFLEAHNLGYSDEVSIRAGSQALVRLLVQTGRPLDELVVSDLAEFKAALHQRKEVSNKGFRHYHGALLVVEQVLFHLGVFAVAPVSQITPEPFSCRMAEVHPALRDGFVAYLERKSGTCKPKTVSSIATRLAHFGRFMAEHDAALGSFAELKRQAHVEPYLNYVARVRNPKNDLPFTLSYQVQLIVTLGSFFRDITEWDWADVPTRRLIFSSDVPRLPTPLPRYIPLDEDRRLRVALTETEYPLAALALRVLRATGLRIGELLDLELDCVHEVPMNGSWLKVPLGKLDTERMVPLEEETVALIDEIVGLRSNGRPLAHPRTGRPCQFLFTHHGIRLSPSAVRDELRRACERAQIDLVTPHQLRHTFATSMVNAGVSLQVLMALLGHSSAEMSLRYGRLFDTTIRSEYERALNELKAAIPPAAPKMHPSIPVTGDQPWQGLPLIKSRLSGGHCLRALAQEACIYANICEHCTNFRVDETNLAVLVTQRHDTETLASDAMSRGWSTEADRHQRLVHRLDALIAQASSQ